MRKLSKIVLSLSVVVSLLSISPISSAWHIGNKDEERVLTFTPNATNSASCPVLQPVKFKYVANSMGKGMKVTQSANGFTDLTQESRTPLLKQKAAMFMDSLSGQGSKVALIGVLSWGVYDTAGVYEVEAQKTANSSSTCTGTFTIKSNAVTAGGIS